MSLIYMGGWMMIPLLVISIAVMTIIIEKALIFYWNPLPKVIQAKKAKGANSFSEISELASQIRSKVWLKEFAESLSDNASPLPVYENNLQVALENIADFLDKRLQLLLTLAKISPLIGLLGTVLGIIQTFSTIAGSTSGIDMELLSQGIWQALITTATGLIIAVPALLFFRVFQSAINERMKVLNSISNAAGVLRGIE